MRGPALLFCPADRPERFAKAATAADTVILDLEDGVLPKERPTARDAVKAARLDPATTIVRVNPVGTDDHALDLAAVAATPYRTIMLAKTESAAQLATLAGYDVVALCETAAGVLAAAEIAAAPNVVAVMWGAEDLIASTRGRSSRRPDGAYRDLPRFARNSVFLAASAAGKIAVDAVHLDIADVEGLHAEVEDAASVGFGATACIHPTQVAVIREGYAPSPDDVAWAHRVLDAASAQNGVFRFEGRMIDEPILRQARRLVESAAQA